MADFLLELFSEEIPAGMQERAASELLSLLKKALSALNPRDAAALYGPRRLAATMTLDAQSTAQRVSERGPRENAPAKALEGFTRKHGVTADALVLENGFWVLNRQIEPVQAATLIAQALPDLLWRFPWPKSMRWGDGSAFTWVRPLRRIVCLLDGQVVPFSLAREGDEAHGLRSDALSEGHRFLAPGAFEVQSCRHWREELQARYVMIDAEKRKETIRLAIDRLAREKNLRIVQDEALVEEVAGLVEYPVALLGRIDARFMDLPAEVMQVSMRVNQRYFALRTPDGKAAPCFAFIANMIFQDGGALTVAGNERVLRARFADARHFWDLDRKIPLAGRVSALDAVTFHAKLGTQGERARRLERLAGLVAEAMGLCADDVKRARRAGLLAKADLTTGMVGEFPELQGVMGGYYAAHDGEDEAVSRAVAEHYMPRGLQDETARSPVSAALALADRIDLLACFFAIGETPSGSGDPYGLRRAALGIIRTIRDNGLRIDLTALLDLAGRDRPEGSRTELAAFLAERLRVQLRNEGKRHDILAAILAGGLDGDLSRLLARTEALSEMVGTEDGINLLAAAKRAANILRIEDRKDGPHQGPPDRTLFTQDEERDLADGLEQATGMIVPALEAERYAEAMRAIAALRPVLNRFFEAVTVNAEDAALRANRLKLLSEFGRITTLIADFSQIEG